MRVAVYPADETGCGYHRMIWPAQILAESGLDVNVVQAENRQVMMIMEGDRVHEVHIPDVDVVVFQRVTHPLIVQAIEVLNARGIATVVDVDDDLSAIHPNNPAWHALHPNQPGRRDGRPAHSWENVVDACRIATLVTASTPALLERYAKHGRGRVLRNYLADCYYDVPHEDSDVIGWPASLHSHPNDPDVVGTALTRLVDDGARFIVAGDPVGVGRAFALQKDPTAVPVTNDPREWPAVVAGLGIGICPLADTRFNTAKSWLKPLELSAVGVPWVGSPRAEYSLLHTHGCGILAERQRDWYRALNRLRNDPTQRAELSAAGREVAGRLRLRDHAWEWAEAWSDACDLAQIRQTA